MTEQCPTQECHCDLFTAIKEHIHANPEIKSLLPTSTEDPTENYIWEEGHAPENQKIPYSTIFALGRLTIGNHSDGISSPEQVRIRVYDSSGRSRKLLDTITNELKSACLCIMGVPNSRNCCFKLRSSRDVTLGSARMSEGVYNTFWETL